MQQGRGGMGSPSGRPAQSPRLRLVKKLAAEHGEYDKRPHRRAPLEFAGVRAALNTRGGRR